MQEACGLRAAATERNSRQYSSLTHTVSATIQARWNVSFPILVKVSAQSPQQCLRLREVLVAMVSALPFWFSPRHTLGDPQRAPVAMHSPGNWDVTGPETPDSDLTAGGMPGY